MKPCLICLLLFLCAEGTAQPAAKRGEKKQTSGKTLNQLILNPLCPPGVYIADPEVRVMPNGRIYLYGSRDEPGHAWCSRSYNILSTSDLVTWNIDQTSFATEGVGKQTDYTNKILYAPDCIYRDGKYFLYYCLEGGGDDEGVAVADSPYGPFVNGKIMEGAKGIDPSVFIDDDGQAYLFWGQAYPKGSKLSKDMMRLEGKIKDSILTYDKHFFNEGGSLRKRNGIYYYVYAGHQRHGESNCATLNYATAKSPLGPYAFRGVIIDNWTSAKNLVNNHGCIQEINGQWYVFYHRPTHGTSTMRKACAEPITFNADGTIAEVEMTTQGIGAPMNPLTRMDAARACQMSGNVMAKVNRPTNDAPSEYLAEIQDGDYAVWKYFLFDNNKKAKKFVCKTWGENQEAKIEIHLDSPVGKRLGICDIKPNGPQTAYAIHSAPVIGTQGKHALALVFKGIKNDKNSSLMNLDWFIFE
ncbi:MAG: hypothetical protein CRN43_10845 [Candidatus Nephrothrix sp. EaCA]|nr:MAG: hypothetical protein CRN43_10845 [Candidatus Nephrothrix sp. EaCA]